MRTKQHNSPSTGKHPRHARSSSEQRKPQLVREQAAPEEPEQSPPTGDAGGGISEGSLRDASGKETGGGVDTPLHADDSTEATIQREQPLHQGTSAYAGGGADNGSNL